MTQYIQYDEQGNITAVIESDGLQAPVCDRQLAFDTPQETEGKKVNVETAALVDAGEG